MFSDPRETPARLDKILQDKFQTVLRERDAWMERALKAEHEAEHDLMTGVFNRRGMYRMAGEKQYNFVYVFDLNGLKIVNDREGHDAGDRMILGVVEVLKQVATVGEGFVARTGGDEFVALTNHLLQFENDSRFSFGWYKLHPAWSLDRALEKADARMYVRKVSYRERTQ